VCALIREAFLTPGEAAQWTQALPSTSSVFGSLEFARIVAAHGVALPRLYVVGDAGGGIVYPLLLRSISDLPFAVPTLTAEMFDSVSPEYTGPMVDRAPSAVITATYADHFASFCRRERIVAEYAHLHPWRVNIAGLSTEDVRFDREIVYVDLTMSDAHTWESLTQACRKNINRARRESVRVFPATSAGDIREFHRIYVHTMERNRALARYYFPLEYFMDLFEQMPLNARFVLAACQDNVVAGTLYLHDGADVYSYLGGADDAFQQLRPTNAVVYETIQWAKQQGKQRLILGGGYTTDDGIFRFKASFSPLRARFHVYRRVHLPEPYAALCSACADHYGAPVAVDGYFPAYRAVPPDAPACEVQ
jgi:serine/alanine adding enzyme